MINIALRLKRLRQWKSLSQKQLAELAGVSQSTIAQIEAEKMSPSVKTLESISKGLGVHPEVFFWKSENDFVDVLKGVSK